MFKRIAFCIVALLILTTALADAQDRRSPIRSFEVLSSGTFTFTNTDTAGYGSGAVKLHAFVGDTVVSSYISLDDVIPTWVYGSSTVTETVANDTAGIGISSSTVAAVGNSGADSLMAIMKLFEMQNDPTITKAVSETYRYGVPLILMVQVDTTTFTTDDYLRSFIFEVQGLTASSTFTGASVSSPKAIGSYIASSEGTLTPTSATNNEVSSRTFNLYPAVQGVRIRGRIPPADTTSFVNSGSSLVRYQLLAPIEVKK